MKNYTLVVMAAGIGSRFGGPKQITPVGPNGEFIIDYSIYDAIKAGFTKAVFIIKKEHYEIFQNTIAKRINKNIEVEYVFQELNDIPSDVEIPKDRVKPWGTDHAILCAKNSIEGPFAIINADDFYGRDSYFKAIKFLKESESDKEQAVISYPYGVTSSDYGSVKRAVLELENDDVIDLIESKITTTGNTAKCAPLDGSEEFEIELDHPVSMNLFCFKKSFLNKIEEDFINFLHTTKDLTKDEALIPNTVRHYLNKKDISLKNIVSEGLWTGVTYKEDLPLLQETIKNLINNNEYPEDLWSKEVKE